LEQNRAKRKKVFMEIVWCFSTSFRYAMVDGESPPILLGLILFLVAVEYVKDRIFPCLLGVQTAKVIVHKRFNCLVNVINYAIQFVVFIRVDLCGVKGRDEQRRKR
jgi:hypothetical protein